MNITLINALCSAILHQPLTVYSLAIRTSTNPTSTNPTSINPTSTNPTSTNLNIFLGDWLAFLRSLALFAYGPLSQDDITLYVCSQTHCIY